MFQTHYECMRLRDDCCRIPHDECRTDGLERESHEGLSLSRAAYSGIIWRSVLVCRLRSRLELVY